MTKLALIIVIQLIYVPMLTLRTISMVKNLKRLTTLFGFLEALIYVFGLTLVLSGDSNTAELVVYALGFAVGLLVGMLVEQKMAIGYITMLVNINHADPQLTALLRGQGFGVTVFKGEGQSGERYRLDILTSRKREKEVLRIIEQHAPDAFIVSYEPTRFKGGYLTQVMRRRQLPRVNRAQKDELRGLRMEWKTILRLWKR